MSLFSCSALPSTSLFVAKFGYPLPNEWMNGFFNKRSDVFFLSQLASLVVDVFLPAGIQRLRPTSDHQHYRKNKIEEEQADNLARGGNVIWLARQAKTKIIQMVDYLKI